MKITANEFKAVEKFIHFALITDAIISFNTPWQSPLQRTVSGRSCAGRWSETFDQFQRPRNSGKAVLFMPKRMLRLGGSRPAVQPFSDPGPGVGSDWTVTLAAINAEECNLSLRRSPDHIVLHRWSAIERMADARWTSVVPVFA